MRIQTALVQRLIEHLPLPAALRFIHPGVCGVRHTLCDPAALAQNAPALPGTMSNAGLTPYPELFRIEGAF